MGGRRTPGPWEAQLPPSLVLLVLTAAFVQLSAKLLSPELRPDSERVRGLGRVVLPRAMPTGQAHSLWEEGLTSPSAPITEGHVLPQSLPSCCCSLSREVTSLAGLNAGAHPAEAVAGGRATGKALLQQQHTSIRAATGQCHGLQHLCPAGLPSHGQRHGPRAGHAKLPKPGAHTALPFVFFSPRASLSSLRARGCESTGLQMSSHGGCHRCCGPPRKRAMANPAAGWSPSESTASEKACGGREAGKGQDMEQRPGNNSTAHLWPAQQKKHVFHLSLAWRLFAFEDETIHPHGNVGKSTFRGFFCLLVFPSQLKLIRGTSPKVTLATRQSLPLQLRFRIRIYAQIHPVLAPNGIGLHQPAYSCRFPEKGAGLQTATGTGCQRNVTEQRPRWKSSWVSPVTCQRTLVILHVSWINGTDFQDGAGLERGQSVSVLLSLTKTKTLAMDGPRLMQPSSATISARQGEFICLLCSSLLRQTFRSTKQGIQQQNRSPPFSYHSSVFCSKEKNPAFSASSPEQL